MVLHLSERQQTAERLTRELQALGATVVSAPGSDRLQFWVDDYKKREVLQQLADAGHEPIFTGMTPQVDVKTYSMGLVNSFEINLPAERQPVTDDRTIRGELASSASKPSYETEQLMRYLGWPPSQKR
jgi:hypothetical protein